ncbi:major tail protein [Clostridium paraputrificum]|uniref:major tail protein n=1 Tax=Clostridium paraputrificum TaxID=29363 RepID=UPI003F5F5889
MSIKRQIGIRDFHVAVLNENTDIAGGTPTYETITKIPGIITATCSTERTSDSFYSDDTVEDTYSSFNQITVELEVSNLSIAERKLLLGQNTKKGVAVGNVDDTPNYVAIMFRSKKTNGSFRYVCMPKGKFTEPSESYASEAESVTAQTLTMTFTGIPLKANGNYKIVADEEESDIDATFIENFFKQVPIDLPAEATVLKAKKK